MSVILKSKAGDNSYTVLTNIDPNDWRPAEVVTNGEMPNTRADNTAAWHDMDFTVNMSGFSNVSACDYNIYLKINDPKETSTNRRCIRFANKGNIWNPDIGANFIGVVNVN